MTDSDSAESIVLKSKLDSIPDVDNAYIIVVGSKNSDDINYINNITKSDLEIDCTGLELLGQSSTDNNSICRFCMSSNSSSRKLLPLFDSTTKFNLIHVNIKDVVEYLTSLKVSEDDELPKYVCNICISRLEICWAFREQCLKSDKVMRELNQASKRFCNIVSTQFPDYTESNPLNYDDGEEKIEKGCVVVEDDVTKVKKVLERKKSKFNRAKSSTKLSTKLKRCKIIKSGTQSQKDVEFDVNNYPKYVSEKQVCDDQRESVEESDSNKKSGSLEYPLSCQICGKLYKIETSLSMHVKNVHKESVKTHFNSRYFKCDICNIVLNKNIVYNHFLKHKTEIK